MTVNHEIIGQALRLLQNPEEASRNRSYDNFSHNAGQKALHLYRIIKSLENEFKTSQGLGSFEVGPSEENMVEIRFSNPALHYTRICYLPRELFSWLADRLGALGHPLEAPAG